MLRSNQHSSNKGRQRTLEAAVAHGRGGQRRSNVNQCRWRYSNRGLKGRQSWAGGAAPGGKKVRRRTSGGRGGQDTADPEGGDVRGGQDGADLEAGGGGPERAGSAGAASAGGRAGAARG